jgi:hypothetical protein
MSYVSFSLFKPHFWLKYIKNLLTILYVLKMKFLDRFFKKRSKLVPSTKTKEGEIKNTHKEREVFDAQICIDPANNHA